MATENHPTVGLLTKHSSRATLMFTRSCGRSPASLDLQFWSCPLWCEPISPGLGAG